MKVIIDSAQNIAAMAAQQYVALLKRKPNAILGGATGSTPLGLYAELIRLNKAGEISFKNASSFNLDEYVGLDGTHDQSYRYFMDHNLFDHIDIDKSRTGRKNIRSTVLRTGPVYKGRKNRSSHTCADPGHVCAYRRPDRCFPADRAACRSTNTGGVKDGRKHAGCHGGSL